MKAAIRRGKIVHNWKSFGDSEDLLKSDCGMVFNRAFLTLATRLDRICGNCSKHRG